MACGLENGVAIWDYRTLDTPLECLESILSNGARRSGLRVPVDEPPFERRRQGADMGFPDDPEVLAWDRHDFECVRGRCSPAPRP